MSWKDPFAYQIVFSDHSHFSCDGYLGLFENEAALNRLLKSRELPLFPEGFFTLTRQAYRDMMAESTLAIDPDELNNCPEEARFFPCTDLLPSLQVLSSYWKGKHLQMQSDWTLMQAMLGAKKSKISAEELENNQEANGQKAPFWLPDDWIISRHYTKMKNRERFAWTGDDFAFIGFLERDLDHLRGLLDILGKLEVKLKEKAKRGLSCHFLRS